MGLSERSLKGKRSHGSTTQKAFARHRYCRRTSPSATLPSSTIFTSPESKGLSNSGKVWVFNKESRPKIILSRWYITVLLLLLIMTGVWLLTPSFGSRYKSKKTSSRTCSKGLELYFISMGRQCFDPNGCQVYFLYSDLFVRRTCYLSLFRVFLPRSQLRTQTWCSGPPLFTLPL